MVKVHCFTNLDDFKRQEWPNNLVAVPRVGDHVEAKSRMCLRIAAITWKFDGSLLIELNR